MGILLSYDWPGNVNELHTAIEGAVVLCPGLNITAFDFPAEIRKRSGDLGCACTQDQVCKEPQQMAEVLDRFQRTLILKTLEAIGITKTTPPKSLA